MDWKQAFLAQAQSDLSVYDSLGTIGEVEDCHRLHYLQMVTEKLAKSYFAVPGNVIDPPEPTHAGFVRLLQVIKSIPQIRDQLGIQDATSFRAYVNSLLPFAQTIQSLAPAIAGATRPNPEYPWFDAASVHVVAPCMFEFSEFRADRPQMVRLLKLVRELLQLASEV